MSSARARTRCAHRTRPRAPVASAALGALAALAATACGEDPAEPEPEPDVAGEYALVGFGGDTLPATAVDPADACIHLTMLSGSLVLEDSKAFTLEQRYRYAGSCDDDQGGERDRVVAGRFEADSSGATTVEITLTPDERSRWWSMEGVVDEGRVTLRADIPPEDRDAELIRAYLFEIQM